MPEGLELQPRLLRLHNMAQPRPRQRATLPCCATTWEACARGRAVSVRQGVRARTPCSVPSELHADPAAAAAWRHWRWVSGKGEARRVLTYVTREIASWREGRPDETQRDSTRACVSPSRDRLAVSPSREMTWHHDAGLPPPSPSRRAARASIAPTPHPFTPRCVLLRATCACADRLPLGCARGQVVSCVCRAASHTARYCTLHAPASSVSRAIATYAHAARVRGALVARRCACASRADMERLSHAQHCR